MAQKPALIALDLDMTKTNPLREVMVRTPIREVWVKTPTRGGGGKVKIPTIRAVEAGVTETDMIGVITMTRIRVMVIAKIREAVTKVIETKITTDLVIPNATIEVWQSFQSWR